MAKNDPAEQDVTLNMAQLVELVQSMAKAQMLDAEAISTIAALPSESHATPRQPRAASRALRVGCCGSNIAQARRREAFHAASWPASSASRTVKNAFSAARRKARMRTRVVAASRRSSTS